MTSDIKTVRDMLSRIYPDRSIKVGCDEWKHRCRGRILCETQYAVTIYEPSGGVLFLQSGPSLMELVSLAIDSVDNSLAKEVDNDTA